MRKLAIDPHRELPVDGLDAAGGQFDVFGAQRGLDIGHRQPACRQRAAVEPDPHGIGLIAADPHPRDAVEHREAVHQIAAGIVGQLRHGHPVAGQVQPHDDVFVAVDLLDVRRLGLHRELIQDAGDAVADVVGGAVDVAVDVELHRDLGAPVLAAGLHGADALDAGDAVFDQLRDAGLDHVGRGAGVDGLDGDHRRVDVRILAQRQAVEGDQTKGDQQ